MEQTYKKLRLACYTTNLSMSVVANLPPLLFLTFRSMYGISYSLLGLLVLINFSTQLAIDLIFSFFSHKFNISKTVKLTPFLSVIGLTVYALSPFFFPDNVYLGLVVGTLIFSASSGLAEVLISPVIAALPSNDPERDMSKLHSVYAWGVVFVIIVSTLFILCFGTENWQWLALLLASIPLISFLLFTNSTIPKIQTQSNVSGALKFLKNKKLWLCVFAIFLGGAAELSMAQWCSGYLELALGIPKVWGDIFGVALFAAMMGLGRTIYAKRGKNVTSILFWGSIGATACYLIAAVTNIAVLGLLACAFTGLFVSMLWPGSLIVATEFFPQGGVFIYALMAAGGDLGASVGPQLVGSVTDLAMSIPQAISFAERLGLTPEQLGMKMGMLIGMLFPLIAVPIYFSINKKIKRM